MPGTTQFLKQKKANSLLLYLLDLLGANSYIWKIKHIKLHHSFPNVAGWDSDMQQHGLIKLFPSDKDKKNTQVPAHNNFLSVSVILF
jgi:linoleoyl-CoA desaturase